MKQNKNIAFVLLLLAFTASGQIHVTPFAGINSTRLKLGDDYKNGGNYPFGGIEIEGRLKPHKISPFHLSLVTGVSYLANGYFENFLFSFPALRFYDARTTDLSTRYLQIPLVIKLNWQPFPLLEDFHFFVGAGLSYNFLLKATLSEKSTHVIFSIGYPQPPPQTTYYEDSQEIQNLGVKQSLFYRIEFGARFRRLQVAVRISTSFKDMYYKGLENVWQIPSGSSGYISGHMSAGTTKEKYSELAIGYRIF